jgi:hypothetical protein
MTQFQNLAIEWVTSLLYVSILGVTFGPRVPLCLQVYPCFQCHCITIYWCRKSPSASFPVHCSLLFYNLALDYVTAEERVKILKRHYSGEDESTLDLYVAMDLSLGFFISPKGKYRA